MPTTTGSLAEFKINVRIKLAALWIAVMFCYVYGDFFSLFVPGRIQNLMNGRSGVGDTTPTQLLLFAILMTLPSLMIFLSLVLSPKLSRGLNIAIGIFFTAVMILVVATSMDAWRTFYTYLGIIEILLTCMIVVYAWRWPRQ